MTARHWNDVTIQFKGPEARDYVEERAEIRLSECEMAISIPHRYLVIGKKVDYFFAGVDSLEHEIHVDVKARWALLGDVYAGVWIEDGVEYLICFRLTRNQRR